MLLDGVGEARARGIVAYRDEHGPFRSIDDLEAVPRMPAGWVEKAREHLTVSSAGSSDSPAPAVPPVRPEDAR